MKIRRMMVFALSSLLIVSCKTTAPVAPVPEMGPYRNPIAPEPVSPKGQLDFNRNELPEGVRGRFSSYDGGPFAVYFNPRVSGDLPAKQVFDATVRPLLAGMGYRSRVGDFTFGDSRGLYLPKADLTAVATETCREVADEKYSRFHPVCNALMTGQTNPIAERVLQLAYGMSVAQFRNDFERQRIVYPFVQQASGVPIEHTIVVAERNDGETVTKVYGTVFNRYRIVNAKTLSVVEAIASGQKRVNGFKGIDAKYRPEFRLPPAVLVLLPYGNAPDGSTALRYAYRTLLFARANDPRHTLLSWMAWIDAENGNVLELAPQFDDIAASGLTWKRDPNTPTQVRSFTVDASSGGQYTLQRSGVFNRPDRLGDSAFDDDEVTISDSASGSSATFANFNQATINDSANSLCSAGGNNTFRQVNAYAHLTSFREELIGAGTFPTFPEAALTVFMDLPQESNSAGYDSVGVGQSRLNLGTGLGGFTGGGCPDVSGGVLPGSLDATPLTHEFMHIGTKRLQERRPADWCGMAPCTMPASVMRTSFHDYADAWAHAYASTPCMGGWYRKNMGGAANGSINCLTHDEGGFLPRLASVSEPFSTATILDHFPERRATLTGDYADMQIIDAALWLTRQGMRSKCLPSGTPQYWLRINRALYNSGFVTNTCVNCDRDIYLFAQNLMQQMTQQWATAGLAGGPPGFAHNGAHTTNKLVSGWARAGIFLIPHTCIDGDATTGDPTFCPVASGGENGGDAIGDVFDNDAADDVVIDQITHVEMDWIQRGDPPPTFRIWTGPRYKFNATGSASGYTPSVATPSPCNTKFRVEMASDDAFTVNVVNGPWTNVNTTSQPECYGTWSPDPADWTTLSGTTGDVKVYYRVRTRDAADLNEKLSTLPGSGSYSVPPSYVVVNNAGQP